MESFFIWGAAIPGMYAGGQCLATALPLQVICKGNFGVIYYNDILSLRFYLLVETVHSIVYLAYRCYFVVEDQPFPKTFFHKFNMVDNY